MNDIQLIQGDITTVAVDAIVNAANTSLLGGGGVDGAIHKKGGPKILEECRKIRNAQGGCKVGEAVITTGGNLPATYVIHAVGPTWKDGENNEPEILKGTYKNVLKIALENDIHSVAFPNISTGRYRFPKDLAASIAINAVVDFLKEDAENQVTFVCFDSENFEIYTKLLAELESL